MTRLFLLRLAGATALAALAAILIAGPAARAATLRTSVTVDRDIVTLGDLFEGADGLSGTPVFRAPDLGVEGVLPVAAALDAARAAGLPVDPTDAERVIVIRASTPVGEREVVGLLRPGLAERLGVAPDSLDLALDGMIETVAADASAENPVLLAGLSLQQGSGRFTARLDIDVGAETRTMTVAGRTIEMADVPVLLRAIERHQVVQGGDIGLRRVEARRMSRSALREADAIVGMAAVRPLRAGDTVGANDIDRPKLVRRGDLVTLTFQRPGIALTARGRALADGAVGDSVAVLNEQSRRTVYGVATAEGVVAVAATPAVTVAAADTALPQETTR